MSDNEDQKTVKFKITPSTDLLDLDSTIRLDLGGNQNVVSTSPSNEITSDDFDKTIDGLMDIEELLNSEDNSEPADEVETLSTDDIDFGELDAGIDALSKDLLEPASETDEFVAGDDSLDDLDKPFDENNEDEAMFDFEATIPPGESDNEIDSFLSSPDDLPIVVNEDEEESTETDPLLDIVEDIDLNGDETTEEIEQVEEMPPVIELTEEMLDEPDQPLSPELNDSQDSENNSEGKSDEYEVVEDDGDLNLENISETPELTTTETNVLADATAAIREIAEEEKEMAVSEDEPTISSPVQTPVEQTGSSSSLPAFMGLLGMAVGGFGAWMAYDASNKVADLERQIMNMSPVAKSDQAQGIADIQQRLTKVERRLTGTPTIEAAAPLGSTASTPEKAVPETKAVVKVITPQTSLSEAVAKPGDWVVNLSSHAKESLAIKEQARLQKNGLNAQVHTALVKGRTWYRVQITGFAAKDEAKAQLRDIQQKSGIKGAWIGKK
ncbi:MAG: SPOR domain-containing protein [Mariprofundaceae bacterium]